MFAIAALDNYKRAVFNNVLGGDNNIISANFKIGSASSAMRSYNLDCGLARVISCGNMLKICLLYTSDAADE